MKKVLIASILILCGFALYINLFPSNESVAGSDKSTRKLFLGTRKKVSSLKQTYSQIQASGECEEAIDQLEEIDFNIPVEDWRESLEISSLEKCNEPLYQKRITSIKTNCFEQLDEETCSQQAIFLRSQMRTRGITEAEDPGLLADMIISEFADSKPDFHKLETYSEKLLNLDPDQAAYQKLWASSKVIARMEDQKSPIDLEDEITQRIDEKVWNDSEMQGLKMAVATGLAPVNVEEYARGFLSQKSDPRMHEVLGWALWRQNRSTEAVQELQKAIQLNPNDQWLKDQLSKVTSKDADIETYQARISLGINLQDLYN